MPVATGYSLWATIGRRRNKCRDFFQVKAIEAKNVKRVFHRAKKTNMRRLDACLSSAVCF